MAGETGLDPGHSSSSDGLDHSSDSDDVEFSCEVCDKYFSGVKPLLQHEKGARHQRALRRRRAAAMGDYATETPTALPDATPFAECRPCGKQFSGPESHQQHLKGRSHRKQLVRARLLEQIEKETDSPSLFGAAAPDGEGAAGSPESPPLPDLEPFAECRPCGKQFSGPESYQQHLKGRSHRKQLVGARLLEQVRKQKKDRPLGAASSTTFPVPSDEDEKEDEGEDDATSKVFLCEECGKAFTGVDPFYRHLLSKSHLRTLRQKGVLVGVDLEGDVLTCRVCKTAFSGPESAQAHLKGKGHSKKMEQAEWKRKMKGAGRTKTGHPPQKNAAEGKGSGDISHPENTKTCSKDDKHAEDDSMFQEDTKLQDDAEVTERSKPIEEDPVGSNPPEEPFETPESSVWV